MTAREMAVQDIYRAYAKGQVDGFIKDDGTINSEFRKELDRILITYGNERLEEAASECDASIRNILKTESRPLEAGLMVGPLIATKERIRALKEKAE